jgi:hypothetical protein
MNEQQGQPILKSVKPADTNYATIYTSGDGYSVISSVIIAWNDPANATVAWYDGTTDWVIADAIPGAAGHVAILDLKGFLLPAGKLLKVKTSDADEITFTVTGVFVQRK